MRGLAPEVTSGMRYGGSVSAGQREQERQKKEQSRSFILRRETDHPFCDAHVVVSLSGGSPNSIPVISLSVKSCYSSVIRRYVILEVATII